MPSKIPKMPSRNPPKPPLPFSTKLFMSVVSILLRASIRRDGSVNRLLLSLFDLKSPPNPKPVRGVATSDHTVDPARNLRVRLFTPSASNHTSPPLPVIVYFHGGGFAFHSAFSRGFDALCRRLSRQIPALVVSVDYRLAPEHRYPSAYDDGLDVLRWLDSNNNIIAGEMSAVFLAGDSAGGSIAHHVARRAMVEPPFSRLTLVGLVLIQPFFGGEEDTESEKSLEGVPFGSRELYKWMWRAFLPVGSSLDHEAANVFGPGSGTEEEGWAGFPKTMVAIGGFDTLQDRQRWYCKGMERAGVGVGVVDYPNAVHGFYAFPELPDAKQFVVDVGDFVRMRSEECSSKWSKHVNINSESN